MPFQISFDKKSRNFITRFFFFLFIVSFTNFQARELKYLADEIVFICDEKKRKRINNISPILPLISTDRYLFAANEVDQYRGLLSSFSKKKGRSVTSRGRAVNLIFMGVARTVGERKVLAIADDSQTRFGNGLARSNGSRPTRIRR